MTWDWLYSPAWWASTVVATIGGGLVVAYLKPRVDRYLESVSSRYRRRQEARREKFEWEVNRTRKADLLTLVGYLQRSIFSGTEATLSLLLVVFFAVAAFELAHDQAWFVPVVGVMALLTTWIGAMALLDVYRVTRLILSADKARMEELLAQYNLRSDDPTATDDPGHGDQT